MVVKVSLTRPEVSSKLKQDLVFRMIPKFCIDRVGVDDLDRIQHSKIRLSQLSIV